MATIQIDIPDTQVQRVLEAFADRFGWVDQATSGTKGAFAKQRIGIWIKQVTLDYERKKSEEQALATAAPVTPVDVT